MRCPQPFLVILVATALLTTVLPSATWADNDDKDKAKIRGVIVAVNLDGSYQVQEYGERAPRWHVILQRGAEIEDDDDDDKRAPRLKVGDVVEVKGRLLGGRTLLAKKIKLLAHSANPVIAAPPGRAQPPAPQAQPAPGNPPNTLMQIIKTLGVGAAVKIFAQPLNSFINTLLLNHGAAVQAQTKVVPILSIAIGINTPGSAYVGAAQVSGTAAALAKVQAVAVIEADYQREFRVKALIPVDNLQPWVAFRRVPGVGVSAIIDLKI